MKEVHIVPHCSVCGGPLAVLSSSSGYGYGECPTCNGSKRVNQLQEELILARDEIVRLRMKIQGLFDVLKHGDLEHQAWLKAKIDEYFGNGG